MISSKPCSFSHQNHMLLNLETLCAHIRTRPHETPAQLAAHFGCSRFYLSHWFRAQTGISLRDYLAALKIEQGIAPLVAQKSVIESQLDAGHASAGTYSNRFRLHTGLVPSLYREIAAALGAALNKQLADATPRVVSYVGFHPAAHPQVQPLHVRIEGAGSGSVVFVALYREPFPRGAPVLGLALFHGAQGEVMFVPDGRYYLMACELKPASYLLHYFCLDHCHRALDFEPLDFPLAAPATRTLALRPLRAEDPPITVNLPKLLFDVLGNLRNL